MPKIAAPTVAEHHDRQRRALLDAAVAILQEGGVAAVTPAAVGSRAGLARSSVYQYFGSGAEIIATVVEEAFPPANAVLAAALEGIADPLEQVDTYVATTLRLGAAGAHRVAAALSAAELPVGCRDRLRDLHREQARPLLDAVAGLGCPSPALAAALAGGVVQAALTQVEAGRPVTEVTQRALQLLHRGLPGCTSAEEDAAAPR